MATLSPTTLWWPKTATFSLIDALDFSPAADGEKQSSAYASPGGSRLERDRFAVTKIAEEIFALTEFPPQFAAKLAAAIATCRDKDPRLATLLPLEEAIEEVQKALRSPADDDLELLSLSLSIRGSDTGLLSPDEGYFYLRMYSASERSAATLHIRGAAEEIEIRLDKSGSPISARRRTSTQTQIGVVARHEFHRLHANITVVYP